MNKTEVAGISARLGKEKSVQKMFSSIAKHYDLNNTLLSLGLHSFWKKSAVKSLKLKEGDCVLDLCSGTGDLALLISQKVTGKGKVIAADLNLEMLKVGKAKPHDNVTFVRCNAEFTGFKDNSFDSVSVAFGMRNLANLEKGFGEIYRVLKKGGRVVCLEFSTPRWLFLRMIYNLYSFTLLPIIGRIVSGDQTNVYQYLPESIRIFPNQERLAGIMRDAGFVNVSYDSLSGGIVAIHKGEK